ncbi:MAG TPA: lycopene cyclase domain-containing protein [Egibacteraceae bacterium]|nr:lycopene cyclase domain-containing protein [Egibacteraceae bacterium]
MAYGYTLLCAVALALTFGLERVLRTGVFRSRVYWVAMAIVAFFQVLVDGWLTCRPIVTYAEEQFSSVRFGCPDWAVFTAGGMPLEDVAFGFAMVTQALMWWVWWGRRLAAAPDRGR